MKTTSRPPQGIALVETLVVLSVVSVLLMSITVQIVTNRRALEHRQYERQATWLSRAGAEIAAARLLADPSKYTGETVEPIPRSHVRVAIERPKDQPELYRVTIEARYPTNGRDLVVRSTTRTFRRVLEGDKARIEAVRSK